MSVNEQKKSMKRPLFSTRTYVFIPIVTLIVYPLLLFAYVKLFNVEHFPLYLLLPVLIGACLTVAKVMVYRIDIVSNKVDAFDDLDNGAALFGAGMKYRE